MSKYLDALYTQRDALVASRDAALAGLDEIATASETRGETTFTDEEKAAITEHRKAIAEVKRQLDGDDATESLNARIAELEAEVGRAEVVRKAAPTFIRKPDAPEVTEVRNMNRGELRDHSLRALEDKAAFAHLDNADDVRAQLERKINTQRSFGTMGRFDGADIARRLLLTENDTYRAAFLKGVTQSTPVFTPEEARAITEFRAMSIGTDASGGFGVPVLIDPTIILTSQGSLNPFRKISRVIQITNDEWKGVSSAGVSWSVDAEAAAVSDDTPTLAQPVVTTGMARGYIPFSIEVGMDYPGFAAEMGTLLLEGYDELQASHFATASTGSTNRGILTALDANTNVEVTPTTDGAFGAVDINKVWGQLPDRFKANATWVMNHDVGNEVSSFSTSGMGSFYTVDLSQGNAPQLKGRPVEFASYFADFTGTTGASNILVVGDFRNFVIVDRAGMNIELLPLVVDVTNNRPTGERGWFAWARFGSNSVNDRGFRLLQNQ